MTRINKERGDLINPCDKVAKPEKQPSKVVPAEVGRRKIFFLHSDFQFESVGDREGDLKLDVF